MNAPQIPGAATQWEAELVAYLRYAEERIRALEDQVGILNSRLHDHEQTVPHEEAQA
jgi:hypothetical protein